MDGRTKHVKIVITIGRDSGSAEWINIILIIRHDGFSKVVAK